MTNELVELDVAACWDLVPTQPICRIAWVSGTGPTIIPVNHVVHERALWIRTSAFSTLVEEVDDSPVAVLVDAVDPGTRQGWSVQLRGTAHLHVRADEVPAEVRELHTWASGAKPLWVHLRPTDVVGRRLVAGD